jgi:hypothetical protein
MSDFGTSQLLQHVPTLLIPCRLPSPWHLLPMELLVRTAPPRHRHRSLFRAGGLKRRKKKEKVGRKMVNVRKNLRV